MTTSMLKLKKSLEPGGNSGGGKKKGTFYVTGQHWLIFSVCKNNIRFSSKLMLIEYLQYRDPGMIITFGNIIFRGVTNRP